jgi:hypothetical protein
VLDEGQMHALVEASAAKTALVDAVVVLVVPVPVPNLVARAELVLDQLDQVFEILLYYLAQSPNPSFQVS